MPREVIFVQVGQCGNQIGGRFWDQALREHSQHSKSSPPHATTGREPVYDYSMSSFFQNHSSHAADSHRMGVGERISSLKARAVLVDMEEGVVQRLLRSHLGSVFDDAQFVTAVSGCGNNWAHGHMECGPQYREAILEKIRRQAEQCDSLQSFFLLHSLGGGTGSGLGTYILSQLADTYPGAYRFTSSIFPSANDDVITSPYNAFFALSELKQHADCVFPMENEALLRLSQRQLQQQAGSATSPSGGRSFTASRASLARIQALARPKLAANENATEAQIRNSGRLLSGTAASAHARKARAGETSVALSQPQQPAAGKEVAFAHMNSMAAQLLLDLTSSMRFKGSLNIDLNEITTNLVPFGGGLHFLHASFAPLVAMPHLDPEKCTTNAKSVTERQARVSVWLFGSTTCVCLTCEYGIDRAVVVSVSAVHVGDNGIGEAASHRVPVFRAFFCSEPIDCRGFCPQPTSGRCAAGAG